MRNIYSILILSLFSNIIFAQSNNNGYKLDSIYSYCWNVAGYWVHSAKNVYYYNSTGNVTINFIYYQESGESTWELLSKDEYNYNSVGNKVLKIRYNWDSNVNDWTFYYKLDYSYNSFGNEDVETVYLWDSSLSDWSLYNKYEYVYDLIDNISLRVIYKWDASENNWIYSIKNEYSYDSIGNIVLENRYNWDSSVNDWDDYNFICNTEYVYDEEYKIITKTDSIWDAIGYDGGTGANNYTQKYDYTYDSNNNLIVKEQSGYGLLYKEEYFYSELVAIIDTASFIVTVLNNCEIEFLYEGDDFGSVEVIYNNDTTEYFTNPFTVNICTKSNSEITIILHKENGDAAIVTYKIEDIMSVEEITTNTLNIYPNPTINDINIITNTNTKSHIEILNLSGQKIFEKEFSTKINIDLSDYSKGMYIVKVISENNSYSEKMILK